jgi:hypothetical protein
MWNDQMGYKLAAQQKMNKKVSLLPRATLSVSLILGIIFLAILNAAFVMNERELAVCAVTVRLTKCLLEVRNDCCIFDKTIF